MCKAIRAELRILDVAHLDAVFGKRESKLLTADVILRRRPPGENQDSQRDAN
jgi:hypothetical protein